MIYCYSVEQICSYPVIADVGLHVIVLFIFLNTARTAVTVSAKDALHMRLLHQHLKFARERDTKSERFVDTQYFFSIPCTVKPRLSR